MNLNREGTFIARPVEWGVKIETGKCPQFGVRFETIYESNGEGGWSDTSGEQIFGWFTLRNRDGSPSRINLENLRDALGWSDGKISTLNDTDWSNVECQIVTEFEEYNGKNRLKVKYLNPRDFTGGSGIKKADSQAIRDLDAQFGAAVRATLGVKAGGNGKAALAKSAPPDAAQKAKREAWEAFKASTKDIDETTRAETWKAKVRVYFKGKPVEMLTAAEWSQFAADKFAAPLGDSPIAEKEFNETDIPF